MTLTIRPSDPCPCGSGKPYEQCCGRDAQEESRTREQKKHPHKHENPTCGCGQ